MRRILMTSFVLALGLAAFASQAVAAVTINEHVTLTGTVIDNCTGEPVDMVMISHLLGREEVDGQGVAHLGTTVTTRLEGISASGARFVGQFHQTQQLRGDLGSTTTLTFTDNTNMIRIGENGTTDDFRSHATVHFTLNANGELVSSKFDFEFECA